MSSSEHNEDQSVVGAPEKEAKGDIPAAVDATPAPFTIFTMREKWYIINLAAWSSLFSPLTANVYFPAIPVMAEQFHKSTEQINLTVTVYMVFQGVTPMLFGNLADRSGRRPIFMICLLILALSCVGLALCPTDAYWLLMLLRCIQAAGSASTVALASGVMGDIITRQERGVFTGVLMFAPSVGPTLGPIIGGGLTQGLGWRSIFWFLCIASSICAIIVALFMPETLRNLVGNGSIRPSFWYRPLVPLMPRNRDDSAQDASTIPPQRKLINPLRILVSPDVFILLFFMAVQYAIFYGVLASLSSLFSVVYPYLNQTEIGLCFLALGSGNTIGTLGMGKLLDREYSRFRTKWLARRRREAGGDEGDVDENDFPIERARLRLMPWCLTPFLLCTIGYGWCLQFRVHIAVPLILQFIMGGCVSGFFNIITALTIDVFPNQGGAITACNNLFRCLLGALMVGVFDIILNALGMGWTYVLLGLIGFAMYPLTNVVMRWGPVWRENRRRATEK
ncbi:MFS general substrate transporter [Peniophora sp. CONT]|nr:MFS general substrate transporter [Peniophora sp. CONT]